MRLGFVPLAACFAISLSLAWTQGEAVAARENPTPQEVEDVLPVGGALTGREIFERYLENRLDSAVQYQQVISYDPGGSAQRTRSWLRWKDYRAVDAASDVAGKWLVKFTDPFDVRSTGYLSIMRTNRSSEQFVYQRSRREVRRVKLRGTSVLGSDFTVDDIAFDNIEDADYVRLPDAEVAGRQVYVVESVFKPFVDSVYRRTIVSLEKRRFVPLLTRYFDAAGVERKQLSAEPESFEEFEGVWVAMRSTMYDLREKTHSELTIESLVPNPDLPDTLFSVFRLRKDSDRAEDR